MKLSEISFFQTQKWTFDMMDSLGSLVLTLNEIFAMLNTILRTKKWNDFYHAGLNNVFNLLILFYLNIFLAFSGFIDSIAEECDRKQGKRGGVTRSKGTRAGSRTRVHCRASAHGSCTLPTELSSGPCFTYSIAFHLQKYSEPLLSPFWMTFAEICSVCFVSCPKKVFSQLQLPFQKLYLKFVVLATSHLKCVFSSK